MTDRSAEPAAALDALSPVDGRYADKLPRAARPVQRSGADPRTACGSRPRGSWSSPRTCACRSSPASSGRCSTPPPRSPPAPRRAEAQAVKAEERSTNHDVKAVEYLLRGAARGRRRQRPPSSSSCTSPAPPRTSTTSPTRSCSGARAATRCCCRRSSASAQLARRSCARVRRGADAGAHPRPAGEPDDARQGARQRRARACARQRGVLAARRARSAR